MPLTRFTVLVVSAALFIIGCTGASPTPTAEPTATAEPTTAPMPVTPEDGMEVARQFGCSACHTADGNTSIGPTWQGLFGAERPLRDGTSVTADDAYLRESILDPNAKVAEGFREDVMPQNFSERLSDEQIEAVIAYIKSLE